jgi:hypothetical protein
MRVKPVMRRATPEDASYCRHTKVAKAVKEALKKQEKELERLKKAEQREVSA